MARVHVTKPRPHVGVITLDHPERMNSMSFELVRDLYAAISEVAQENDTWVVVLTGAGRGFCSGMDLEDPGVCPGIDGLPVSRVGMKAMAFMSDVVPALRDMPQPVIAAVNGAAIGGGMCLTLGADIRIAGASARFKGAGVTNGLTGTELGVTFLLPRLVGGSRASELLLTGREVGAEEAERIGLVSRVVPDDELMEAALDLASGICELSPHGVSMTKRVIWANLEAASLTAAIDLENRNQLLLGMTTSNLQEAIAARKQKRKPDFTDS